MSPEDVVGMVTDADESDTNAASRNDELDGVEEVVQASPLKKARQQFRSLAAFLADNTDDTAQDEVSFQRLLDKAAKMGVTRIN